MAFAAKGPGCACALFGPELGLLCAFGAERMGRAGDGFVGRVAHAPFLGRDLARLTLRFWAERMGRAGGGFNGRGCACTLLPGVWLGLLCAFGSNALGWPVAFQWAGVAGIGKGYFSSSAAGEQNSPPQGFPEHAFFSITTGLPPGFTQACFSLAFPRLFAKNKNRPRRKSAEVFDFTMADRLLGKRHEISLLILKKTNFTFSPFSNAHRFSFAVFENPNKIHVFSRRQNRLNARDSLYFRAAKKTLGLISQTLKVPFYACLFFRWPETLPLNELSPFFLSQARIRSVSGGWRLALRPGAQWARGTASRKHTSSRCYGKIRCSWDRRPVRRKCRA